MTAYMLDTDMCSYIIRERPIQVLEHLQQHAMEQIHISVVSYAELLYGVELSSSKKVNRAVIAEFVLHLGVLPWDAAAAEEYGNIRAFLKKEGQIIGAMDLMIAAHARSQKMILVSNNDRHFRRVPRLKLENWVN